MDNIILPLKQTHTLLSPVSDRDVTAAEYSIVGTRPGPDWVPFYAGLIFASEMFEPSPIAEWMIRNSHPDVLSEITFHKPWMKPWQDPWDRRLWFCRPDAWPSLSDYLKRLTSINWPLQSVACTFLHKAILIDPRAPFEFPGRSWLTSWLNFVQTGQFGTEPKPLILQVIGLSTANCTLHLVSGECPYIADAGSDDETAIVQNAVFGSQRD